MTTYNHLEILKIARSWLGTKWQHNQCLKGEAVDCVHFLKAVADEVQYPLGEIPANYARTSLKNEIEGYLDCYFKRKKDLTIEECNIILFKFAGYNTHVGIATSSKTVIHASIRDKRVIEHAIDGKWKRIIVGVWELIEE